MTSLTRKHEFGRWRAGVWLRLTMLLCVFLLGAVSTAQACHTHDDASAAGKNSPVNVPADHCALCLAMHAAMPVAAETGPLLVQQVGTLAKETRELRRARVWSVSLFSRPPPGSARSAFPGDGRKDVLHGVV